MGLKRPYAPVPFWFLNDRLTETELLRQIAEMDRVGVGGFVLHPRVGLPRDQGWMSKPLLAMLRACCAEAKRRGLRVVLYDEGMYPSGSASGQVVAENPAWQCRALVARDTPTVSPGENVEAEFAAPDGTRKWCVSIPLPSVIRGLHYTTLDDGGPASPPSDAEDNPPAADLLNPEAMAAFLRLVHDRYAEALGEFFGDTVTGIFTDEPSLLGRPLPLTGVTTSAGMRLQPGTCGILDEVRRITGRDFVGDLGALFFDAPGSAETRRAWHRAVRLRMEQTYYAPMSAWCLRHGLELMGHPERPDDLALQRYFHVPGQDLVWRWVLPGPTATRGPQSTQAKSAASAAAHLGRPRNSNEFCGAYGHELTFEEMKWLADHCLVRGQNLLIPHAYYYSVRGPRRDERPPDVGLNSEWVDRLPAFNAYVERMSRLVAESTPVVTVALLATGDEAPDAAAETLLQNQIDFHYLEDDWLTDGRARVTPDGVRVGAFLYTAVVHDALGAVPEDFPPCLLHRTSDPDWLDRLLAVPGVRTLDVSPPAPALRVRRMITPAGHETVLAFNEGTTPVEFTARGVTRATDAYTGEPAVAGPLRMSAGQALLLG